jgi:hypothetical protein
VRHRDGSLIAEDEKKEAKVGASRPWRRQPRKRGSRSNAARSAASGSKEGVRWRGTHSWAEPRDKDASPKRTRVVSHERFPSRELDDHLHG